MIVTAPPGQHIDPGMARFRATAFELLRTGVFVPHRSHLGPWERPHVRLQLAPAAPQGGIEIAIELLRPEGYLFLPSGTVAIEAPVRIRLDRVGGVLVSDQIRGPLTYRVWIERGSKRPLGHPGPEDRVVPWRRAALTGLAREATRAAVSRMEKAQAIVRFLQHRCRYTLSLPERYSPDPIGDFLFKERRGHCELFAGAMVTLLRSIGIEARIVGGYSGGELLHRGRVLEVREENAHTWVEVWIPKEGWMWFDPTPADDVPQVRMKSGFDAIRRVVDAIELFWDRSVLTFDLRDQARVLAAALKLVAHLERSAVAGVFLCLFAAMGVGAWILSRHRRIGSGRGPAARAMWTLERKLERSGFNVPASATLRAVGRLAVSAWPGAETAIAQLLTLAEAELYGNGPPNPNQVRVVSRLRREIGRMGRARRPSTGPPVSGMYR